MEKRNTLANSSPLDMKMLDDDDWQIIGSQSSCGPSPEGDRLKAHESGIIVHWQNNNPESLRLKTTKSQESKLLKFPGSLPVQNLKEQNYHEYGELSQLIEEERQFEQNLKHKSSLKMKYGSQTQRNFQTQFDSQKFLATKKVNIQLGGSDKVTH